VPTDQHTSPVVTVAMCKAAGIVVNRAEFSYTFSYRKIKLFQVEIPN
jgi:hypothetical protein